MTAIEGVGGPPVPRTGARVFPTTTATFRVPSGSTGRAGAASEAAPTMALASMLSLQESGDEAAGDRQAHRHAQELLAELASLQRALLAGTDDPAALQRLATLASALPTATDRRLAALVSAILLRVRVELARRAS